MGSVGNATLMSATVVILAVPIILTVGKTAISVFNRFSQEWRTVTI
jgi:hypothetical protein